VAQVRRWAGEGRSQAWIAARYGVARSVVSRLLAQFGPIAVQPELGESPDAPVDEAAVQVHAEPVPAEPVQAEPTAVTSVDIAPAPGSARISTGSHSCRYAGAMLLHAYLDRVGAAGASRAARRGPRSLSDGKNGAGSACRQARADSPTARGSDQAAGRDMSPHSPLQWLILDASTHRAARPGNAARGRSVPSPHSCPRRRHRGAGGRSLARLREPLPRASGRARNRASPGPVNPTSGQVSRIATGRRLNPGRSPTATGDCRPRSVQASEKSTGGSLQAGVI